MTEAEVQTHSAASTANEHTRWNFVVMIVEAVFSSAGLAWTDPGTVLPVFIGLLGGSTVLVGLVPVLMQIGWILPQLPIAALVGHVPERRPYLRWGVTIGRLPFLAFVAYLWVAGTRNAAAVLVFLLFGYFSMALGNGFIAVLVQDLTAKSIPSGLRGRFLGLMQLSCAVAAVGVGFRMPLSQCGRLSGDRRHLLSPHVKRFVHPEGRALQSAPRSQRNAGLRREEQQGAIPIGAGK